MKKFKEHLEEKKLLSKYEPFLEFCREYLELDELPEITLINDKSQAIENKSFGGYSPGTQSIKINIAERHLADVFRTLAHELTHYKQHLDDRLDENSGETGSEIENEANAMAGIIMREYAKESEGSIFEEMQIKLGRSRYANQVNYLNSKLHELYKSGGIDSCRKHLNSLPENNIRHLRALKLFNMGYSNKTIHPITKIIERHLKAIDN